jgi:hypothetical protein
MEVVACPWCDVAVQDGERSVLVIGFHRWCVVGAFDVERWAHPLDQALAREIRRCAARAARRAMTVRLSLLQGGIN